MITKEKLFNDIERVHNKYGYINRTILHNEISEYNVDWQVSKYHGLKNICNELGLTYIDYSAISKDKLKEDLLRVYNDTGKLSIELYDKYGKYSSSAVKSHFGSFNKCLIELGIDRNVTRNDSNEEIEKDFWDFYSKYKTTSSTLYRKYGRYSQSVIESRYGSWVKFIKYLGLKPLNEKVGIEAMIQSVRELYCEYGYLTTKLINDNCDFTYQALTSHIKKDELQQLICGNNVLNGKRSKGEEIVYSIIHDKYPDTIREYTESWLKNNKTNHHLYVDFYIPSKNTAIEYDGQQHNNYIPYLYNNSFKRFYDSIYRDRLKEKLLKQHGIHVIRFNYDEPITKEYVLSKIENI